MISLDQLSPTELDDLRYFLSKKFDCEVGKPIWYTRNTSIYYNKTNPKETFTHTIECSFPFLRYYLFFRELEVSRLGYFILDKELTVEKITDPEIIKRIKKSEKIISKELKKYLVKSK